MYLPKYRKCLSKAINLPITLIIDFSLHLVYYSSSRLCLYFSLYFFYRTRVELVGSVSGKVRVLKKHEGG